MLERGGNLARVGTPKVEIDARRVATDGWAALNRLGDHEAIIQVVDAREAESGVDGLGACVDLFHSLGEGSAWGVVECVGRVETRYSDHSLEKFCSAHGVATHTAYRFRRIYAAFPPSERVLDLSLAHHYVAATTDEPKKWLDKAAKKAWSVRDFMEEVAKATQKALPSNGDGTEDVESGAEEMIEAAAKVSTVEEAEQLIRAVVRNLKTMGDFNKRVLTRFAKAMAEEGGVR